MERTAKYSQMQEWARRRLGDPNVFQFWCPPNGFLHASRSDDFVSFTRKSADGVFGMSIGGEFFVDPEWESFALSRSIPKELTQGFTLQGQFDAYGILPGQQQYEAETHFFDDDAAIRAFLEEHAPDSSTWPGNPEIIFWAAIFDDQGALAGIGAMTQWESGEKIISSVAVRSDLRARGVGKSLMRSIIVEARRRQYPRVALGVAAKNVGAKKVYESVGFTCMAQFNAFRR